MWEMRGGGWVGGVGGVRWGKRTVGEVVVSTVVLGYPFSTRHCIPASPSTPTLSRARPRGACRDAISIFEVFSFFFASYLSAFVP